MEKALPNYYLEDSYLFQLQTTVKQITLQPNNKLILLERTIFHP